MFRGHTSLTLRSVGACAVLGVGYFLGLNDSRTHLAAQTPAVKATPVAATPSAPVVAPIDGKRLVATIYGNVPITREEFGDYLINRYAADRLELYVNKRIIEEAARRKGVDCTDLEITAVIMEDCKIMQITVKDFVSTYLKQQKKTWTEWREDVVRPRVLLTKLYRDKVTVTDEELKRKFESLYGEKIQARLILWPKEQERVARMEWEIARKSDEAYEKKAREQGDPGLASQGGVVVMSRYMGDDSKLEDELYKLKDGEVSSLIPCAVGYVVMKPMKRIPADATADFVKSKEMLTREIVNLKLAKEVQMNVAGLQKDAGAQIYLKPKEVRMADVMKDVDYRDVEKELEGTLPPKANTVPTTK